MMSSITGTASIAAYFHYANLKKISYTKPIIGDIQWRATADSRKANSENYLDVRLECVKKNNASDAWFCDVELEFNCARDDEKTFTRTINHRFKESAMSCEVISFPYLAGCEDSVMFIDVQITLKPKEDIVKIPLTDFEKSQNIDDEIVLLVGDRKLYVDKHQLMSHSTLFRKMLSSEGSERKEIEFWDVQYEEMVSLLRFVNLEHLSITDDNINGLLKLADRYGVRKVMVYCERFLIDTNKITIVDKLCHADKYKLKELQKIVIKKITKAEIAEIFEDPKYKIGAQTEKALMVKACTMKDDTSEDEDYHEEFYTEEKGLSELQQELIFLGVLFFGFLISVLMLLCLPK